jgi:hypothetical protein
MLPELPAVSSDVLVAVGGGPPHPSRVEAVEPPILRLVAPRSVGDPPPGAEVSLQWTGRRGLYFAPTELMAVEGRRDGDSWLVRMLAGVEIEQRRRHDRAEASGRVQLAPEAEDGVVVTGQLIDIGAGGLRCHIDESSGLQPGQPVSVRLVVDGRLVSLGGTVLRLEGGSGLVVHFDPATSGAETIRDYVERQRVIDRRRPGT